jgi:hypothetical protein
MQKRDLLNNDRMHEAESRNTSSELSGLTPRVVIFSIVVMFILSIIVQRADVAKLHHGIDGRSVPSPAAILVVVLVMGVAALLNKIKVRLNISQGELSLIYIIISIGGLLLGYGLIGPFVFTIMTLQRLAVENPNIWSSVLEKMSSLILPKGDDAVVGFWVGDSSVPWSEWFIPLVMWGLFFGALLFIFVCIASLIRQRWIEHERLRFPIVLPVLEITNKPEGEGYFGSFWTDRLVWLGALIAVVITGSRMLNQYFPVLPAIPTHIQLGRFFQDEPFKTGLNSVPAFDFYINPLIFAIGYFVSLDITFTFWLTYIFGQLGSRIIGTAYGNTHYGVQFQYLHGSGVWLAIAIALFWMSRQTIKEIVIRALNPHKETQLEEADLPMSYNTALFGGLIAFVFVVLFSTEFLQFTPVMAVVFWGVFILNAFTFSRLRAESGLPTNDATVPDFKMNMAWAFGNRSIRSSVSNMTWGYVTNLFQAMPALTIESFKIAHDAKIRKRSVVASVLLAFVCAYIFGVPLLSAMSSVQ